MKNWLDAEKHEPQTKRDRVVEVLLGRLSALTMIALIASAVLTLSAPSPAYGHGGRLAADGCHNDRSTETRHCHRGSTPAPQRATSGEVYYPNCDAARAAGAAPVRRGQPGYGRHLDRDNDGVGCE